MHMVILASALLSTVTTHLAAWHTQWQHHNDCWIWTKCCVMPEKVWSWKYINAEKIYLRIAPYRPPLGCPWLGKHLVHLQVAIQGEKEQAATIQGEAILLSRSLTRLRYRQLLLLQKLVIWYWERDSMIMKAFLMLKSWKWPSWEID